MTESTKLNQQQKIIHFIKANGSITKMDGFAIGITKSDTRISELRRKGYPIVDEWVEKIGADGEKIRYKKYFLKEA